MSIERVKDAIVRRWPKRLGRVRTSTVVLAILFVALLWVQQTYRPAPSPPAQVVPPGFVPNPDYTWVPRTQVAPPRTTTQTPTTTTETPTTTTTTSETPTTTPTVPITPGDTLTTTFPPGGPTTTVIDPDGPGPLPPITLPLLPGLTPAPSPTPPEPGEVPAAPTLPR